MTTVIVCGGRGYADGGTLFAKLDELRSKHFITDVRQGGAPGADALALAWARKRGLDRETFKADWKRHGRAAGPMRNQAMLDRGGVDLVVAFPGGRGTADMVRRARERGVPVVKIA